MSFILDALKKSESERQRTKTPGIADVPETTARRTSKNWAWIVGALLAVNIVFLIVVLTRPDSEPATESVAGDSPAAVNSEVGDTGVTGAGTEAARTETKPFSDLVAQAKRNQPVDPPAPASSTSPPDAGAATSKPATKTPRAVITESPPTFNDLRAKGSLELPDLHLDIHVFSEKAEDRFVFINMNKYKEKATLTEGPVIEEITPEGVILGYSGQTFLLPRE